MQSRGGKAEAYKIYLAIGPYPHSSKLPPSADTEIGRSLRWRGDPAGHGVLMLKDVQPVGEFLTGEGLGGSRADVGAQPCDLPYGNHGVQSGPATDIPSICLCEALGVFLRGPAKPAAGVVDLYQVPLARSHSDMVPVAQDDPAE